MQHIYLTFAPKQQGLGLWKIAKKTNSIVKIGCGSVRKFVYFFQVMEFKFKKKSGKKQKKNGKNSKQKKEAGAMYCLIYIYIFQILLWTFKFSKKNLNFSQF